MGSSGAHITHTLYIQTHCTHIHTLTLTLTYTFTSMGSSGVSMGGATDDANNDNSQQAAEATMQVGSPSERTTLFHNNPISEQPSLRIP